MNVPTFTTNGGADGNHHQHQLPVPSANSFQFGPRGTAVGPARPQVMASNLIPYTTHMQPPAHIPSTAVLLSQPPVDATPFTAPTAPSGTVAHPLPSAWSSFQFNPTVRIRSKGHRARLRRKAEDEWAAQNDLPPPTRATRTQNLPANQPGAAATRKHIHDHIKHWRDAHGSGGTPPLPVFPNGTDVLPRGTPKTNAFDNWERTVMSAFAVLPDIDSRSYVETRCHICFGNAAAQKGGQNCGTKPLTRHLQRRHEDMNPAADNYWLADKEDDDQADLDYLKSLLDQRPRTDVGQGHMALWVAMLQIQDTPFQ